MIVFLYVHNDLVSIVLAAVLGTIFFAFYTKKMSSQPPNRWTPASIQSIISTRIAILGIVFVVIVLVIMLIGGILEHQRIELMRGMLVGTFVGALVYCGFMVLLIRLTAPKNQAR